MRCSSLDTGRAGCRGRGGAGRLRIEGASRRRDGAHERTAGLPGPPGGVRSGSRTGGVAAGLRRLRAEQCGTDHGLGPGAAEFVCEEPARFVRYDFDLMRG